MAAWDGVDPAFARSHPEVAHLVVSARLFLEGAGVSGPRFADLREPNDVSEGRPASLHNCVEATHFLRHVLRSELPAVGRGQGFWTPVVARVRGPEALEWHAILLGMPDGVTPELMAALTAERPGKDGLGFLHIGSKRLDISGMDPDAIDAEDMRQETRFYPVLPVPQLWALDVTADQAGLPPIVVHPVTTQSVQQVVVGDGPVATFTIVPDERPVDPNSNTLAAWGEEWRACRQTCLDQARAAIMERAALAAPMPEAFPII